MPSGTTQWYCKGDSGEPIRRNTRLSTPFTLTSIHSVVAALAYYLAFVDWLKGVCRMAPSTVSPKQACTEPCTFKLLSISELLHAGRDDA